MWNRNFSGHTAVKYHAGIQQQDCGICERVFKMEIAISRRTGEET